FRVLLPNVVRSIIGLPSMAASEEMTQGAFERWVAKLVTRRDQTQGLRARARQQQLIGDLAEAETDRERWHSQACRAPQHPAQGFRKLPVTDRVGRNDVHRSDNNFRKQKMLDRPDDVVD